MANQTEEFKNVLHGKKDDSVNEAEAKVEKQIAELQVSEECAFRRIQRGFQCFLNNVYDPSVAGGQHPKFLIFACSDSRVCPTNVLSFLPGEAFMVRNIANLVPAFNQLRYSGVGAAIEYGVGQLQVENILIIGHSRCGGIEALMTLPEDGSTSNDFVHDWAKIGLPAKAKVLAEHPNASLEEQLEICEKEAVNLSLVNIQSYPYVRAAMANDKLKLWGGYYNFVNGTFELWDVKYHITDPTPI